MQRMNCKTQINHSVIKCIYKIKYRESSKGSEHVFLLQPARRWDSRTVRQTRLKPLCRCWSILERETESVPTPGLLLCFVWKDKN